MIPLLTLTGRLNIFHSFFDCSVSTHGTKVPKGPDSGKGTESGNDHRIKIFQNDRLHNITSSIVE